MLHGEKGLFARMCGQKNGGVGPHILAKLQKRGASRNWNLLNLRNTRNPWQKPRFVLAGHVCDGSSEPGLQLADLYGFEYLPAHALTRR